MSADEFKFSQQAVANYKRLAPVIQQGDLFRLRSPYETNQPALLYVDEAQRHAVLFGYNLHTRTNETVLPVELQGLDPAQQYRITEINLMPGQKSELPANAQTFSGDYLMRVGLPTSIAGKRARADQPRAGIGGGVRSFIISLSRGEGQGI